MHKSLTTILSVIVLFLAAAGLATWWWVNQPPPEDQRAYEEVLATLSMAKAKQFCAEHQGSPYASRLGEDLVAWCYHENTRDCFELVLMALPREHSRRAEVMAYYRSHFEDAGGKE